MTTVIQAKKPLALEFFKELWSSKELLYFFTWRDLKIRYKQTVLGVMWALFQPFITMVIFTVFFGKFGKIPSDNIPYPVFVFAGLLLWQLFSATLLQASGSLVGNQNLLTKVYFPRLILPISSLFSNLVDFFIASSILVGLMIYYSYIPHLIGLTLVPLLVIITCVFAVGLGLFLASLNVKYRDIKYILPFFVQIMIFLTPVIYPPSILGRYSWLLAINPLTGVIKAMRAALFGGQPINWLLLFLSGSTSLVVLLFGFIYFKRTERQFADLI
ncbi:MAG: ABC transporter permease [Candidatus Vogelbacteria bacterium]|nr:ABC transporter permease [Candidatus Vogelbacteria bacterium]